MDDVQGNKVIRRRKRRASRSKSGTWAAYFRGAEFGRVVFVGMTIIAVLYVARFVWDTRMASIYYNSVVVGMPEQDVRYVLGPPTAVGEGRRFYRYDEGNRTLVTRFSGHNTVTSVTCTADLRYASRCEPILDIPLGTTEDAIMLKIGAPSRNTYSGNDKIMHYDGLGVSLRMRKFRLAAIELHEGGSFIGYLPLAIWRMIP